MDAKQFAWLYLIENGYAGVEPSYYGGWDLINSNSASVYSIDKMFSLKEEFLKKIREVGVNWDKTLEPESDSVCTFQGTFCDSKQKEYLTGKLVLKNGESVVWYADAIEITNVFQMMAEVDVATHRAMELFCS